MTSDNTVSGILVGPGNTENLVRGNTADSVGYEVGRHLGPRLLRTRLLRHRAHRVDAAHDLLALRGGVAVFLGRYIAFPRAVMPALAGAAHMPYRTFLAFNAAGGLVWEPAPSHSATSPGTPTPLSRRPSAAPPP